MFCFLTSLPDRKEFWLTLGAINLVFLPLQPLLLLLTLAVVAPLYLLRGVAAGVQSRLFPRIVRAVVIVSLWFLSGIALTVLFTLLGADPRSDATPGMALAVSTVLWVGVPWVRRRQRERAREQASVSRQTYEQSMLRKSEAQKRRDDARASCEIFYSLHAPEIGSRFTKVMFDDFVRRHMGDERPPEYVEERSRQLREVLQQHLAKCEPPRPRTLEELAAWFQEQKRQIDGLPDGVNKDALRAQLNARYAEMTSQLLEEMHP